MPHRVLAGIAVGCLVGTSQAALFSFDANAGDAAWTFTGGGNLVSDGLRPEDPTVLLVDDVHGPLPPIPFATQFEAALSIEYVRSAAETGGLFTHTYRVNGSFTFLSQTGIPMLRCTVTEGELTATGGALSWYTEAMLHAGSTSGIGSATYEWLPDRILGYNVRRAFYGVSDVEFRLGSVNMGGADVALDPETYLPGGTWVAESSFHGQNREIPAPGAAVVIGLGALMIGRRRRM